MLVAGQLAALGTTKEAAHSADVEGLWPMKDDVTTAHRLN